MAISSSTAILAVNIHQDSAPIRSEQRFQIPLFGKKSQFKCIESGGFKLPKRTQRHVVSKTNESLLSNLAAPELGKQNEQENEESSEKRRLADCWREIAGANDWAGMLDPIDPILRSELIRYGEMVQACYDSFDYDLYSSYCGSCRFIRRQFFQELGMGDCGYEVSRYLYATSTANLTKFFKKSRWPKVWSESANWIGYVAVSNDETSARLGRRDIVVSWRGTVTNLEWVEDMNTFLSPISADKIPCPDPTVRVESGFLDLYTAKDKNCRFCKYSAREQILTEVKRLIEMYPNEELSITMTGHSLGSALATLSAYDVVETGTNVRSDGRTVPVCVYSFAGPRVGNMRFRDRVERLGLKVLRVLNIHDIVPKSPGLFFNESMPRVVAKVVEEQPWCYSHVGVRLELDHKSSPFLRPEEDVGNAHNLEAHLHLLDGYHGKGQKFALTTERDPALVNKSCDFLQDHLTVPPSWKQYENKGMVRTKDGRWILPERPKLDDHPDDMHLYLSKLGLSS
ncbi:Phospholipase A1-Igamma1, chloroplastic [Sarracenia purpurea var. burkii]